MDRYDPKKVESKWQARWREQSLYRAEDSDKREKKYILDMFPYPSGQGLHVGHPEGYTATDIYSRYLRFKKFNVLHPMGWDAFGLPAENYAIKTGTHPADSIAENINNFRRQIESLGMSYDWSREISTASPDYYKWTQWFFLLLYKNGLAYKKKGSVNWCDSCQTVLANEQVVSGACERCGYDVVQKDLEQWYFKITAYAERLLNDLDSLEWPSSIKDMQRHWIGRSEGAEVIFSAISQNKTAELKIFTTRPDTLFGVSFVAVAPEHQILQIFRDSIENWEEVEDYIRQAQRKSALERTDLAKDKSGVLVQGVKVVNPVNKKEEVSLWVADYVLPTYGFGAVMGVPAHDQRDWEFAKKYDLPRKFVIEGAEEDECFVGEGKAMNSGQFDGLSTAEFKEEIVKWLEKNSHGQKAVNYKLRDWLISRQRYWGAPIPIVYDPEGNPHPVKEEHLPLELPRDVDYMPKGTSPLGSSESWQKKAEELYGSGWHFEIDTMDTFVCSAWYFFRFVDPLNKEKFAAKEKLVAWLPVDLYVGGAEHAVLHLLYARFFTKVLKDLGYVNFAEPFTKLRNQGLILGPDGEKMSKSRGNVINPDEVIARYGADTFRMYEMFMGPLEDAKPWDEKGIVGLRRFLEKVYRLAPTTGDENQKALHKVIKKVTADIENFKFNTAIAAMMTYLNDVGGKISASALEKFIIILSPFAPHLAEEIWEKLGHDQSIFLADWPEYDPRLVAEEEIQLVVQVNGRVRDKIMMTRGTAEASVEAVVMDLPKVKPFVDGAEIQRIIHVPDKLINIVTKK
ncbi:MAG: leucine--tRNA ligase [Candidatus Komeilibacteria bacterium]|nr:leucine--tRNA ligase [Candidatus Komeilibacteria bacterium]